MLLRITQSSCCKNCLKPNALGHLLLMIFRFVNRLSMPLGPLDRPTAVTHRHPATGAQRLRRGPDETTILPPDSH